MSYLQYWMHRLMLLFENLVPFKYLNLSECDFYTNSTKNYIIICLYTSYSKKKTRANGPGFSLFFGT